jgi:lipopolysaccharide export system protein LptA
MTACRTPGWWVWLGLGLILGLAAAVNLAGAQTPTARPATAPKQQAPRSGPAPEPEIPLHITAQTMEADQEKNLILFKGQVKAVHGDATLYADELWVFYKPKTEDRKPPADLQKQEASPLGDLGGEKIDRIEARGNVRFVQDDRVATGRQGIYYRDKDEIVLTGNPQVWRGENHLKGDKITYYRATKRVVVESSPRQRVEAHLYQTGQAGAKPPAELLPGAKPGAPKVPKGYKPVPR